MSFERILLWKSTKFKKITESTDKPLYDEMHERLKARYAKRMKIQRSSTVEPVLGSLINFTGMRRIWTRGIKNANKFVLGAAIAYNLKKWLKWQDINKSLTKKYCEVVKTQGNEHNPDLLNDFNAQKNQKLDFLIFLN